MMRRMDLSDSWTRTLSVKRSSESVREEERDDRMSHTWNTARVKGTVVDEGGSCHFDTERAAEINRGDGDDYIGNERL